MDSALLPDSLTAMTKKSYMEELMERPNREYRKMSWTQVSHIIAKGDVNTLSMNDLCYYICHPGPTMQQSKHDHVDNFLNVLEAQIYRYQNDFCHKCNGIVDNTCIVINKEDAVIFKKIRINSNHLEEKIVESIAQVAMQTKLNESLIAIVADIRKEHQRDVITQKLSTGIQLRFRA